MRIAQCWHGVRKRRVVTKKLQPTNVVPKPANLRLGFVPLTDCAPLVMAFERGLFSKYGLKVALNRELGWATIRDKVIHQELDAAHAVTGMPFAATLGLGSIRCDCLTALVLSLHGNAITLSNELWNHGIRDAASLKKEIVRLRGSKTFTFGVVYPFSSHNFLLRGWLASAGINPGHDVRIVVVPPPQMALNLKAGHLDGFCAGEPWNSVAIQSGAGWCAATSAELDPGHPEKVLMVRREFAAKHAAEHLALVAALLEACEFCAAPENHDEIAATLSRREYLNVTAPLLLRGLDGVFDFGHGRVGTVPDFTVFSRDQSNEPGADKAAWVIRQIRLHGEYREPARLNAALGREVFRADLYEKAVALRNSNPAIHHETKTEPQDALA
jgi:ABC-type nitrate/sulfonate/bicarbonate transport system substrate-binding protein